MFLLAFAHGIHLPIPTLQGIIDLQDVLRMKGIFMLHSTVTRKGQTTIPSAVREALHIQSGDKLEYDIQGSQVTIRVHPGIMALQGLLASPKGKGLSFTQIRLAAAEARKRGK